MKNHNSKTPVLIAQGDHVFQGGFRPGLLIRNPKKLGPGTAWWGPAPMRWPTESNYRPKDDPAAKRLKMPLD